MKKHTQINHFLDISYKNITSLEDYFKKNPCPPNIEILNCSNNYLKSLKGCPPNLIEIFCQSNELESLEGCPRSVTKLICSNNKLKSLRHCPPNLINLSCSFNLLKSFERCPFSVIDLFCNKNPISGYDLFFRLSKIHKMNLRKKFKNTFNVSLEGIRHHQKEEIETSEINIYFSNQINKILGKTRALAKIVDDKMESMITLFVVLI